MKTAAVALIGPILFVMLYLTLVRPQEAGAREAQARADVARTELARLRLPMQPSAAAGILPLEPLKGPVEYRALGVIREELAAVATASVPAHPAATVQATPTIDPMSSVVTVRFDAPIGEAANAVTALVDIDGVTELSSVDVVALPEKTHRVVVSVVVTHLAEPTPTPRQRSPSLPDLAVDSILVSGDRRVAFIGGRIVREGERIGSFVVESIEPDSVLVSSDAGEKRRISITSQTRPAQ